MPVTVADSPYTLHIGDNSWPVLREGFSLTFCVGEAGKHRTSSCRLSVKSSSLLQALLSQDGTVDAVVRDSAGDAVFTGVIRPGVSATASQMDLGRIQIEILDYTEKLHIQVYEKTDGEDVEYDGVVMANTWTDLVISNPDDTEHSVVHIVSSLAGFTPSGCPKIETPIYAFSLSHGQYLDEALSSVLYEYCYDYTFDAEGNMRIIQTGPIVTGTDNFGNVVVSDLACTKSLSSFRGSLAVSRNDNVPDGVLVTFPKYMEKGDVQLWSKEFGQGAIILAGYQGGAWEGDISWNTSGLGSVRNLVLSGFWVSSRDTSSWLAGTSAESHALTNVTQTGAHLEVHLNAWGGLGGVPRRTYSVHASARYLTDQTQRVGYAGTNSENYSASYVQDAEEATSLAYSIWTRSKYNMYTYSFQSFVQFEPGELVEISENAVSGISTTVRILSRTVSDETMLYTYEAEGYGKAEYSQPAVDRDETPTLPQDDPDFFTLTASTDTILADDDDDTMPVRATVDGMIFDRYGAVPSWSLNGSLLAGYSGRAVELSKTLFQTGSNLLQATADYDGDTYVRTLRIKSLRATVAVEMQFALLKKGQSPDAGTKWTGTQPVPASDEVVWLRFRTGAGQPWVQMKMAEDGGDPLVYFQWAATSTVAPDNGWDLLTFGDTAITWTLPDGGDLGFVANWGGWESLVPDKPAGLNYLWVKYWSYQKEEWTYFCTTGNPAMDFSITCNPQTIHLTSRGEAKSDQVIVVRIQRINTTAPITVVVDDGLEGAGVTVDYPSEFDDSLLTLTVNAGAKLVSVVLTVSVADVEHEKEVTISAVQEGVAEIMYMGLYPSLDTAPQTTSEGALMEGDHIMVGSDEDGYTPYYWHIDPSTGGSWVMADGNISWNIASKLLPNVLNDALQHPTSQSESIVNLFAANLAAVNAFIQNLGAQFIQLRDGGAIYGGGYDQSGKNDTNTAGFHLSAETGVLKAYGAELYGTFKTEDSNGTVIESVRQQVEAHITESESRFAWVSATYAVQSTALAFETSDMQYRAPGVIARGGTNTLYEFVEGVNLPEEAESIYQSSYFRNNIEGKILIASAEYGYANSYDTSAEGTVRVPAGFSSEHFEFYVAVQVINISVRASWSVSVDGTVAASGSITASGSLHIDSIHKLDVNGGSSIHYRMEQSSTFKDMFPTRLIFFMVAKKYSPSVLRLHPEKDYGSDVVEYYALPFGWSNGPFPAEGGNMFGMSENSLEPMYRPFTQALQDSIFWENSSVFYYRLTDTDLDVYNNSGTELLGSMTAINDAMCQSSSLYWMLDMSIFDGLEDGMHPCDSRSSFFYPFGHDEEMVDAIELQTDTDGKRSVTIYGSKGNDYIYSDGKVISACKASGDISFDIVEQERGLYVSNIYGVDKQSSIGSTTNPFSQISADRIQIKTSLEIYNRQLEAFCSLSLSDDGTVRWR